MTVGHETAEHNTVQQWDAQINEAISAADPLVSNFQITRCHYLLSVALRNAIGENAGANFHSWAVWGSRKAGVTIRQEDKDQASRDATIVAGIVGALVGILVGWTTASLFGLSVGVSVAMWLVIGTITGGYCGYVLAGYTRTAASRLVLKGNRIVLDDIGRVTARYLKYVSDSPPTGDEAALVQFSSQLRDGATKDGGQELLRRAFRQYESARTAVDEKERHEATYLANCLAILHEHIRLQPFISRSMPLLIRKCVTQRLMTYSVGSELLAVHEDVPPLDQADFPPTLQDLTNPELCEFLSGPNGWNVNRKSLRNTRAKDWTVLRERMGYVVNLFRTRHLSPDVVAQALFD